MDIPDTQNYGVCMNKKFYDYLFKKGPLKESDLIEYATYIKDHIDRSSTHGTLLGIYLDMFKKGTLIKQMDQIDIKQFDNIDMETYNKLKEELRKIGDINEQVIKNLFHKHFQCFDVDSVVLERVKKLNETDPNHKAFFDKYFVLIDNRINLKKDDNKNIILFSMIDSPELKKKVTNTYYGDVSQIGGDALKELENLMNSMASSTNPNPIVNEYTGVAEINVLKDKIKYNGKIRTLKELVEEIKANVKSGDFLDYVMKKIQDSSIIIPKALLKTPVIFTPEQVKKFNPMSILFVLEAFEFKKKQIKNSVDTAVLIYQNPNENEYVKKNITDSNAINYLQQLVNYVNGNPSFLNPEYRTVFESDLNSNFEEDCKKKGLALLRVTRSPAEGWRTVREGMIRQPVAFLPAGRIFGPKPGLILIGSDEKNKPMCGGSTPQCSTFITNTIKTVLSNADVNNIHLRDDVKQKLLDMGTEIEKLEKQIIDSLINIQEIQKKNNLLEKEIDINDLNELKIKNKELDISLNQYMKKTEKAQLALLALITK